MQSFLDDVLDDLYSQFDTLEDCVFILPSRRAGVFLKSILARRSRRAGFAPIVLDIESFVEEIAGIESAGFLSQLFELYGAFSELDTKTTQSFYEFCKWAPTLLRDFDEIDRYLVPQQEIFSYLSAIQEVNHWYLQPERTPLMEAYISFWNQLPQLYEHFCKRLLDQGIAHQGMVYRLARQNTASYAAEVGSRFHVFIGFNALNKAESEIIQEFLAAGRAEIYWDLDKELLADPVHDAGYFMRQYFTSWPYYEKKEPKGIRNCFYRKREIQVFGASRQVSQMKFAANLLKGLTTPGDQVNSAAMVLGDESLLNPLIHSLPTQLERVNITMGFPLDQTNLSGFYKELLDMYLSRDSRGWYFKKVLEIAGSPFIQDQLNHMAISAAIHQKNWVYIPSEAIYQLDPENEALLSLLFPAGELSPAVFIKCCQGIVERLKTAFDKAEMKLEREQLYHFYTLFNQLAELSNRYNFIRDLKSLQFLFAELLRNESIDFRGEPLEGIQIMGMLESRLLDFDTVIISSVNEGILPAGKTDNSFVPFDVKKQFGLPTYKDKDAVYTYHFYRLLQRANSVYLLYNTEADVLRGGEKSRLISQLQNDIKIAPYLIEKSIQPQALTTLETKLEISKSPGLLERIAEKAASGFSPTSLAQYVRDPLEFYKKTLLRLQDPQAVEESIAANTYGTLLHLSLEELYTPLLGTVLEPAALRSQRDKISEVVNRNFRRYFEATSLKSGKNFLALRVQIRQIERFIDMEIAACSAHKIEILGLEKALKINFSHPSLPFPVFLKGTIDRLDICDGQLRIIDYKSGGVQPRDLVIADWEELVEDKQVAKAFQVLCYALMQHEQQQFDQATAGVISFRNLGAGFIRFGKKPTKNSRQTTYPLGAAEIDAFKNQLLRLLLEICNPEIPILESAD